LNRKHKLRSGRGIDTVLEVQRVFPLCHRWTSECDDPHTEQKRCGRSLSCSPMESRLFRSQILGWLRNLDLLSVKVLIYSKQKVLQECSFSTIHKKKG
jgi:hypothetical protein